MIKFIEIMSPVGSYESLMAAIQGGASSVYFGVGNLNMRSRSTQNFSIEDLKTISGICSSHNVRSYLTLNTIIYDTELDEMRRLVDAAIEAKVSAVIASDPSVLSYAQRAGAEIHISTQLNITNVESVKWYSHYADVMVLSRELNLDQIKHISQEIERQNICGPSGKPVQIEVFVHGALCMAISGKCYLSLHTMNSSANRGACLQPCRRAYEVTDKETGVALEIDNEYIMSPKDLCTIHILDKIIEAGATVLKIEGRGRSPEYVKTVTRVYHDAVGAIQHGEYTPEMIDSWMEKLKTVYNRGFWEGYYLGRKLGEWSHVYGSQATLRKQYLGKVTHFYSKIGVAEVRLESHDLMPGMQYSINGPTTGVVDGWVEEVRLAYKPVPVAPKGSICSFKVSSPVREGDKVFILEKLNQVSD